MAITILPRGPRTGEQVGSALSQALSSIAGGIQQRQQQQQQLQQQQQIADVFESLGLSPQISSLPESLQRTVASSQLKAQQPTIAKVLGRALGINVGPSIPQQTLMQPQASGLQQARDIQAEDQLPERVAGEGIAQKIGPLIQGAVTQTAGLPGSLLAGGTGLANLLGNVLGFGNILPSHEQLQERIPTAFGTEKMRKELEQTVPGLKAEKFEAPLKPFPTPEQIREKVVKPVAEATGVENIFLPQSKNAKWWQDVGEDFAVLFQPGAGIKGAAKKLGLATTGNMLSWIAKDLGASELTGEGIKLGTYLLGSLNPRGVRQNMRNKYNQWENTLEKAENTKLDFRNVRNQFVKLDKKATSGAINSPANKFMRDRLEEFENLIDPVTRKIDVKAVHQLRRAHNALFDEAKKAKAIPEFKDMLEMEKSMLGKWAKSNAPEAFKGLEAADNMFSTLKKSEDVEGILGSLLTRGNLARSGLAYLFGIPVRGVAAATIGTKYAQKAAKLLKNPEIRKAVFDVISAAAKDNTKVASAALGKLEKRLRKKAPEMLQPISDTNT